MKPLPKLYEAIDAKKIRQRVIEGTSDVVLGVDHRHFIEAAKKYAKLYNIKMLELCDIKIILNNAGNESANVKPIRSKPSTAD